LRSNPFEKKGNDENHLATPHDPLYVLIEPIIRARAKEIKEAFNGLI
jgi:diaminopimelate decarboxylase